MYANALVAKPKRVETHIVGECDLYNEERHVLENEKKITTLNDSEKTIAIRRDRW